MTTLSRGFFLARRKVAQRWVLLVIAAVWPLLGLGVLRGESLARGELPQLSVVTLIAATLLWTTLRDVGATRRPIDESSARELEVGLCLLTGVYTLLALTGGPRSFLYPLVYAVVSFLMVVHRRRFVAYALLVATAGLEVLVAHASREPGVWALVGYHLTFVSFFAAGNILLLGSLVRRLRARQARAVNDAIDQMRQEARDFRLIASQLPPQSRSRSRDEEELRMSHAAVETIHEQLFHNLDLLRTALDLHTCAVLWCEDSPPESVEGAARRKGVRSAPHLAVKEIASTSEYTVSQSRLSSPGILTSVIADPKPLRLRALAGKRVPPYYEGPEAVTDLCALPLLDSQALRGILCADRIDGREFTDAEQRVLEQAGAHLLRIIEHERVFTAVERGKYEQEQFYRASELLNEALTLEQVYERSFAAVQAIAHYDIAVLTGTHGEGVDHDVLAVDVGQRGHDDPSWKALAERLRNLRFADATSLVAMAVKNRHFMPACGEMPDQDTVVFNARTRMRAAKSVLVLPLCRGDEVLGAITLASARARQYPAPTREMLRVIGHQVGVSLQNARMYRSMEERATTDGLTGLTNHRAFQERLGHLHALAERTGQRYSIILTDIDHFKSINDTYGHPIGDQVLKRVAALFAGRARKVDLVARYGGEEFVLVLPDTDAEGAEHFANKLREEVAESVMTSEHGSFKITISMGVASFPADGGERLELIEKADQALYYCKEHGRNCVRRWASLGSRSGYTP